MAEGVTEDPVSTVDVATEEEDMVAVSMATEATEPVGTATETWTIPEPERTAQATENLEEGNTPVERLEAGKTEGGTAAAMAGAPTTAIWTPEVAATAAWSPEDW